MVMLFACFPVCSFNKKSGRHFFLITQTWSGFIHPEAQSVMHNSFQDCFCKKKKKRFYNMEAFFSTFNQLHKSVLSRYQWTPSQTGRQAKNVAFNCLLNITNIWIKSFVSKPQKSRSQLPRDQFLSVLILGHISIEQTQSCMSVAETSQASVKSIYIAPIHNESDLLTLVE